MKSLVVLITASGILALGGYESGRRTGRWQASARTAGVQLLKLPMLFGDWHGRDDDAKELKEAAGWTGLEEFLLRRYRDSRGREVGILFLRGPASPLVAHTPDVCYTANAWKVEGSSEPVAVDLAGSQADFRRLRFKREPHSLQLYYSWLDGASWSAPEQPRLSLAGRTFLYRLYVTCLHLPGEESAADAACHDFLRGFLPYVGQAAAGPVGRIAE